MLKVRVFECLTDRMLEQEMNAWLTNQTNIEIVSMTQSQCENSAINGLSIVVTILYRDGGH